MGFKGIKGDERICLKCTDPQKKGGAVGGDAHCFDLTPMASGKFGTLFDRAVADPQSTFLGTQRDSNGAYSQILYRLTEERRPVTTQTIASLCGGLAPYTWSPKKLKSMVDTIQTPFVSASIATADGGLYTWDVGTKNFEAIGMKSAYQYAKPHLERYKQKIAREVDEWFWSGGARCYVDAAKGQFDSLIEGVVAGITHFFAPPKPPLSKADYCHALVQDNGSDAQEFERRFMQVGRLLAEHYGAGDVSALTFSFCPWKTEDRMAEYSDSEHGIYFYLDLPIAAQRLSSSVEGAFQIVKAATAHEMGHYRYHREAGDGGSTMTAYAGAYGLPETLSMLLDEISAERHLPWACQSNFVTSLRKKRDLPSIASTWHVPTFTEVIAVLYETDQMWSENSASAYENISTQHRLILTTMLASYYKAFPETAFELSRLHGLVMLDPKLGPEAKDLGMSMLADIIRQLPEDAILNVLDFPISCNEPIDLAGLSVERRAQLPADWCDFSSFAKRIRKNTHR